jgi:hypothetical protein
MSEGTGASDMPKKLGEDRCISRQPADVGTRGSGAGSGRGAEDPQEVAGQAKKRKLGDTENSVSDFQRSASDKLT